MEFNQQARRFTQSPCYCHVLNAVTCYLSVPRVYFDSILIPGQTSVMAKQQVSQFSFDFENFIFHPLGKPLFFDFCNKCLNLELFQFVLDVVHFRAQPTAEVAQQIVHLYFATNANRELNVSGALRNQVTQNSATVTATMFDKCYYATQLLLAEDVFPRFLRCTEFEKFVHKASLQELLQMGATPMNQIKQYQITLEMMEREHVECYDFQLAMYLHKDYFAWKLANYDDKQKSFVYQQSQGNIAKEVITKYGQFSMDKTIFYMPQMSATDTCKILNNSSFMRIFFPNIFDIKAVHYESPADKPSYVVHYMHYKAPLLSDRDMCVLGSCMYMPEMKAYCLLFKPSFYVPVSKKYIRLVYMLAIIIQEVDATSCKVTHINVMNTGGWVQIFSAANEKLRISFCKQFIQGSLKAQATFLEHQDKPVNDDLKIMQSCQENASKIKFASLV